MRCQLYQRIDSTRWSLLWVARRTLQCQNAPILRRVYSPQAWLTAPTTHREPCGTHTPLCGDTGLCAGSACCQRQFSSSKFSTNGCFKAILSAVKLWKRSLAPERFAIAVKCFPTTSPDTLSFVLRKEPHFCTMIRRPARRKPRRPRPTNISCLALRNASYHFLILSSICSAGSGT